MSSTNGFNYLFFKRFARLFHVFVPLSRLSVNVHQPYHESCYSHPLILILLILLNEGALQYVIYLVGLLPSKFYAQLGKSPEERNSNDFRWLIFRSFIFVIANAFLKSLSAFLSSLLYVKWRMRLVLYLHSFYFTQQRYYHLANTTQQCQTRDDEELTVSPSNHTIQTTDVDDKDRESIDYFPTQNSTSPAITPSTIDNPDQRIAQDADALCQTLSSIIPLVLISPFTIAFYTYRTWQITGYYGPLAIFVYFVLWTIVNKIFISFVSRIIFQQNIIEGNFRFLHAQVRTYNEPIAFYHGDGFEHKRFDHYFLRNLVPILYRRTWQEFFLGLSTNLYDYIGSILSYLLLALAIFVFHMYDHLSNKELVNIISQTSFITMYLIYRFSLLNDLTDKVTIIAANTHRVQTFVEFMKNIDTTWTGRVNSRSTQQNDILTIKNLSYSTPTNHQNILMKDLNLTLRKGERLLITGDSGVGKTSLFRVLHSLWPVTIQGSFSYQSSIAYLLPQRPYFTNLSLYDELSYPDTQTVPSVERQQRILALLSEWNLSHILDCVESNLFLAPKYAWQDLLSPGELQRLSFLRLLLRLSPFQDAMHPKPDLLFLDEISSSLDGNMEMKMYQYLLEQNLTLISIGHRATLRQYHHFELKLSKHGLYRLENIRRED